MSQFIHPDTRPPALYVRSDERRGFRMPIWVWVMLGLCLLGGTWWWSANHAAPQLAEIESELSSARKQIKKLRSELERTEQQLSISTRGDQVSTAANDTLKDTLREREEEVAALQADLAFFQRLVGGREPKKGLRIQSLVLRPIENSRGFAFRSTLTQTLRRGEVTRGTMAVRVEGIKDNKVTTLALPELPDHSPEGDTIGFTFKYFEALDGSFVLPEAFSPNRVHVSVVSEQGERSEESYSWQQALAAGEPEHVWQ